MRLHHMRLHTHTQWSQSVGQFRAVWEPHIAQLLYRGTWRQQCHRGLWEEEQMVVLPRLAGKWLARMDARWKIEHVKLDVPPDYLLFKNQKLGWASVSLVRFSSILFLAYQLIPTRARNASRAFAAKCCGAAQLHCASNLYIYNFFIIYI